jgi:hypothetical protein
LKGFEMLATVDEKRTTRTRTVELPEDLKVIAHFPGAGGAGFRQRQVVSHYGTLTPS